MRGEPLVVAAFGTHGVFWPRPDSPDDRVVIAEVWTENVYRMVPERIAPGDVVLDLGANVGAFTVLAARLGAVVTAVEPDPRNVDTLRENLDANGATEAVRVIEGAAGDGRHAFGRFVPDEFTDPGGGGTVQPGAGDVAMYSLSGLLDPSQDTAVVKCDIEGGEWAVFGTADPETLSRIRYLTMEWHAPVPGGALGDLVQRLSETHHVDVIGRPSAGGMLYADRL